MPSVAEEYGISDAEWQLLGAEVQQKLVEGQARLIANQQMINQHILEDDDRDIRRRSKAVTSDILGRDTHSCEDKGHEMEDSDDMRITILGDVNSEETFKSILQQKQTGRQPPTEPPAKHPGKKVPWWGRILGTLGAVALGAGITYATARYFQADPTRYDMTALPHVPGYQPLRPSQSETQPTP